MDELSAIIIIMLMEVYIEKQDISRDIFANLACAHFKPQQGYSWPVPKHTDRQQPDGRLDRAQRLSHHPGGGV
jgi:hypothetical protein